MHRPSEKVNLCVSAKRASQLVSKRADVVFDIPEGLEAHVFAPKITIDQILANLLVNAAEAIEAGTIGQGRIEISFRAADLEGSEAVEVLIRDNGEGIDPKALGEVFERGYSTRKTRSGGLGLHWCANTANAMGGRLYAESSGTGKGATLHLILPRSGQVHMESAA
jgi:signal transduction histidine kinase